MTTKNGDGMDSFSGETCSSELPAAKMNGRSSQPAAIPLTWKYDSRRKPPASHTLGCVAVLTSPFSLPGGHQLSVAKHLP